MADFCNQCTKWISEGRNGSNICAVKGNIFDANAIKMTYNVSSKSGKCAI
ncbi:hypothetical protein BRYFOR_09440 [Marvinbryantia formatexigens DSM 14469]|uniref:Uncharacterized protein n=1 Tax=Marvinbryantia formatexigens DSM 14469 TaxID=478749 RepID=C6LL93_9FIRM|nr:hypothetical protein BRYFOR_09440 [Marvinbryantia formatexigens DSM 14469]